MHAGLEKTNPMFSVCVEEYVRLLCTNDILATLPSQNNSLLE